MKKISTISLVSSTLFLSAISAYAQVAVTVSTGSSAAPGQALINLLGLAQSLVNSATPLLIGVALVCLFAGMIYYLWKGRSEEKARNESLKFMGMSILAIFVMVSIWGLVGFLGSAVGVGQGGAVPIPKVPTTVGTY